MRDGTADGVNDIVGDEKVGVRPLRSKGVVARQPQLLAGLPPAVRGSDDPRMQGVFAPRLQPDPPRGGLQNDPFPVLNAHRRGRCRVDLQERLWDLTPQARDVAVLHVAVLHQPEEGEHQRILLGHVGATVGLPPGSW